mmetsp:Transcript_54939/g.61426  ORF Transcript_54939/g.61426 Transcript_54939/m.61426 type:complete len:84 (+) Transcript_54939:351-602(+)
MSHNNNNNNNSSKEGSSRSSRTGRPKLSIPSGHPARYGGRTPDLSHRCLHHGLIRCGEPHRSSAMDDFARDQRLGGDSGSLEM